MSALCVCLSTLSLVLAFLVIVDAWLGIGVKKCTYTGTTLAVVCAFFYIVTQSAWILMDMRDKVGELNDLTWKMVDCLAMYTVYTFHKRVRVCGECRHGVSPPVKDVVVGGSWSQRIGRWFSFGVE